MEDSGLVQVVDSGSERRRRIAVKHPERNREQGPNIMCREESRNGDGCTKILGQSQCDCEGPKRL
jgi:hypothetical protein